MVQRSPLGEDETADLSGSAVGAGAMPVDRVVAFSEVLEAAIVEGRSFDVERVAEKVKPPRAMYSSRMAPPIAGAA